MAKLYFRYGAMSSAKTLNLLAVAHSYQVQKKKVQVMKPQLDTRFGAGVVRSRAGLNREADKLLTVESTFPAETLEGISCILVDECQFLHPRVIERLRDVTVQLQIPVICYGLRTDFRSRLFPGSKRLMEIADVVEEVKTTCTFCNRKATMNIKFVAERATMAGPTICLGAEETYACVCYGHFCEKISGDEGGQSIDFEAAWAEGDKADAEQKLADEHSAPPQKRAAAEAEEAEDETALAAKVRKLGSGPAQMPRAASQEPDQECSPQKA